MDNLSDSQNRVACKCNTEEAINSIRVELGEAKKKHPDFVEHPMSLLSSGITSRTLSLSRAYIEDEERSGHRQGYTVLLCEIAEAMDAYANGDLEHCYQELAQCGAVIIRQMNAVAKEIEAKNDNCWPEAH